ncbi:hypothetical protein Avbf_06727 [Armadillidium vulgare]|nr:hypothetical protein Avbf_06727 [Armadillidium vulgare]
MNLQSRIPFAKQNLIYVLIHCQNVLLSDVRTVFEGLKEVLSISASISGSARIPGIGVGVLKDVYEELLPLTPVKGCIDHILQKLQLLRTLDSYDGGDVSELLVSSLTEVVDKISEFSPNKPRKVKIIIFTWKDGSTLEKSIKGGIPQSSCFHISNIKIIQFGDKSILNVVDPNIPLMDTCSVQITTEIIQANPYAIKMIFKEWLVEESGDIPHLKLTFREDINQTSLYFDMRESAIDMSLLPSAFGTRLNITLSGSRITSTTTGKAASVVNLECTNLINFSSVSANWFCSTIIYLIPSSAEKFNFQEFWDNSQRVNALNASLSLKKEALLCQVIPSQEGTFPQANYLIFIFGQGLAMVQILHPELTLIESQVQNNKSDIPKKYKDQIEEMMKDMTPSDFKLDLLTSNMSCQ